VPDELPSEVAVLIDTLVSVRGVETNMSVVPVMKEGFAQLDTVVVQGAGPVGVMAAFKAKVLGADKVIMIGGPARRLKLATEFGFKRHVPFDTTADLYLEQSLVARTTATDVVSTSVVLPTDGAL